MVCRGISILKFLTSLALHPGERELVEFLAEEITSERKAGKAKKMPTDVEGFHVKTNGAEVEMTKQNDKERIVISFNVNHTVDADDEAEVDPNMEKENFAEMKSSPQFEVDIVRDGKTMSFTCSFLHEQSEEEGYSELQDEFMNGRVANL